MSQGSPSQEYQRYPKSYHYSFPHLLLLLPLHYQQNCCFLQALGIIRNLPQLINLSLLVLSLAAAIGNLLLNYSDLDLTLSPRAAIIRIIIAQLLI